MEGAETEKVDGLLRKYRLSDFSLCYWHKEGNCFHIPLILPYLTDRIQEKIMEKILEKRGLTLKRWTYIPEDMSEPLDDNFYFEVKVSSENLEEGIKHAVNLRNEILREFENAINRLINLSLGLK